MKHKQMDEAERQVCSTRAAAEGTDRKGTENAPLRARGEEGQARSHPTCRTDRGTLPPE